MFEKVNPSHPDKVADRIAGAIVDLCYAAQENPRVAVEVLIGHGSCTVIMESSVVLDVKDIRKVVYRITGDNMIRTECTVVPQDYHLAMNQVHGLRCGDNGIFKGTPLTEEQKKLSAVARDIYSRYQHDGKYIINKGHMTICQSNAATKDLEFLYPGQTINPIGDWTGGTNVDTGATNRKLGSDMGDGVTGGGLHGKDLSKADVSVNIWCFLEAQRTGKEVRACCSIGDDNINGIPYSQIVEEARMFINKLGGFEKFAEWGLF